MAIIQDWKIRSTNARCEITGEAFEDEQEFYTCIFDDPESDGFLRKDYSVDSWNEVKKTTDPAPFSFWRSTYHAPVVDTGDKRHEDTSAEGMLRRFIEEDEQKTENARFILALMLERKKEFVQTDVQETEARRLLFYEQAGTGDVFIVADPGLKLDEIEAVQREVADLLEREERKASGVVVEESSEDQSEETSEDQIDEPREEEGESEGAGSLDIVEEPEGDESESADEEH